MTDSGAPAGVGAMPYGPETAVVRRFLVRLAALDLPAHDAVVDRFSTLSLAPAFGAADLSLGEAIERSGRADARDALAGPLLQLVRDRDAEQPEDAERVALDPIAEPALAALLALLVRDLLSAETLAVLYAPFADVISLNSLLD